MSSSFGERLIPYSIAEEEFASLLNEVCSGQPVVDADARLNLCKQRIELSLKQVSIFLGEDELKKEWTTRLEITLYKYEEFGKHRHRFNVHVWNMFDWYLIYVDGASRNRRVSKRRIESVWNSLLRQKISTLDLEIVRKVAQREFGC